MHQTRLRRRTRLLAVVPAAFLAVTLVGCGLAEDAAKDAAEDAAKSEGVDLNLDDLEDGKVEIDTTEGGTTVGKLPKGFPTDEVPVVDGEILAGNYTKNPASWVASIKVDEAGGDKQAAYDAAAEKLVGAGAETVIEPVDNGTGITGQYSTASYDVNLAVTDANGVDVTYNVSAK